LRTDSKHKIVENFFDLFVANTINFCIFAKNRQNNFHQNEKFRRNIKRIKRKQGITLADNSRLP
jgi:hypothetical protein